MSLLLLLLAGGLYLAGSTIPAATTLGLVLLYLAGFSVYLQRRADTLLAQGNFTESFEHCAEGIVATAHRLSSGRRRRWLACRGMLDTMWQRLQATAPDGMTRPKFLFLAYCGWKLAQRGPNGSGPLHYDRARLIDFARNATREELEATKNTMTGTP